MQIQVHASVVERHNYEAPLTKKFFGVCNVDHCDGEPTDQFDFEVDQYPSVFDSTKPDFRVRYRGGETVVRREIKDAIVEACVAFSARIDRDA